MEVTIDLNSDLGEHPGSTLDEQIMPYISSCNIACGGHVGDEASVKKTIKLAIANGVEVGAHPSFPDRENFGRKELAMNEEELAESLRSQIELVKNATEDAGKKLHHVKPHGALYNLAARSSSISELIVNVIKAIDPELILYGLPGSEMEKAAMAQGLPFVGEAFADRRYEVDGSLRSRSFDDAVIHDQANVLTQVEEIAFNKQVETVQKNITIEAQTICLHSDTAGAVNLARAIQKHLIDKGAIITSV